MGPPAYRQLSKDGLPCLSTQRGRERLSIGAMSDARPADTLRRPKPGPLFFWVKRASWVELALFGALLFFWLMPGFEHETFVFGLSHGIGFIALCLLIWIAVLRREAPYGLLAATLTPAGPVGSVLGIAYIERRLDGPDAESSRR
jgi:hypothetical protein